MKTYELLYIIPSKFTEKETGDISREVEAILKNTQANILESKFLGKRLLSYPINHSHYGIYELIKFETDAPTVKKIDEKLRLTSEIARHQIMKFIETQKPDFEKAKTGRRTEKTKVTRTAPSFESPLAPPGGRDQLQPRAPLRKEPPEPGKEKIKLEELDKKLEEILKE